MSEKITCAVQLSDSEKLLVLAAWFDMWDRPEVDRQAILEDDRFPGKNDVQRDLRRIAARLAGLESRILPAKKPGQPGYNIRP